MKTLKQKTITSSTWVLFGHVLSQVLRLGSNLILTRLLVPEMFGVMAIASVFMTGIVMLSDLGIHQYVIQNKNQVSKREIDTAWTIQVFRGVLIFLALMLLSLCVFYLSKWGIVSERSVYADSDLPLIIAVMSLIGLISGFNSMNLALLNRRLELKKLIIIEFISQLIGLITMVLLAWQYANIWSLVIGAVITALVKMLLSHLPNLGRRNNFGWDRDTAKSIFNFGKWIVGSSIFTFIAAQGDRLLLGLLITPEELGVYTIAFFLAMAFRDVMRKIMSSVFYPVLSEVIRTRPGELKDIYYKIRSKIDAPIMIVVGLLGSLGHIIISVLYDDRYQSAGWMIEVLSLSIIFVGLSMAGTCLLALGQSKIIMKLTATTALFLFISIPVSYSYYGLYGAVVAIALNSIVEVPLLFYYMRKYKLLSLINEVRMFPLAIISYGLGRYTMHVFEL